MTEGSDKDFEMAVGTPNVLDPAGMMAGANDFLPLATNDSENPQYNWTGTKPDFARMCRSCANVFDYLIPIFEGDGILHQLESKVQKHLPIQVTATDTLPKKLCYQCASTLISWDTMINNCLAADKKFKDIQEDAMQEAAMQEAAMQEDAMQEHPKISEAFDDSQSQSQMDDLADDDNGMVNDSDDEPLIRAIEKTKATPIKKKILSKAKSKTAEAKNKTATDSKDDEVDEEERQRIAFEESVKLDALLECELNDINKAIPGGRRKYYKKQRKRICDEDWVEVQGEKIKRKEGSEEKHADLTGLIDQTDIDSIIQEANLLRGVKIISGDGLKGAGSTPYLECPFCQKVIEKSSMSDHLITEHNLVAKKVQRTVECHVCDKTFANKSFLVRHIRRVHERVIKAKCHVCGKTFTDTSNYRQHLLIHAGVKSYMCQICGKGFVQRQGLRMHMPCHSEDYPYSCSQCSKRFRRKQHYELHLLKHTGKKSHQCETCGKFFSVKNELKMHSWIHKEEWPYVCHHCNKGFNQSCGLRLHLKNHHALGS